MVAIRILAGAYTGRQAHRDELQGPRDDPQHDQSAGSRDCDQLGLVFGKSGQNDRDWRNDKIFNLPFL